MRGINSNKLTFILITIIWVYKNIMWNTFKAIWLNIWRIFNPNISVRKKSTYKKDGEWDFSQISWDFNKIWTDMLKVLKK